MKRYSPQIELDEVGMMPEDATISDCEDLVEAVMVENETGEYVKFDEVEAEIKRRAEAQKLACVEAYEIKEAGS